jgi:hypothetical protein
VQDLLALAQAHAARNTFVVEPLGPAI